jgi:hypothetical protein
MNDDIVSRLRLYANASINGGWANVFRADFTAAADEIELLRSTVTDCRIEIERLTAERDEIQRELRRAETESSMLRVECGVIAKERDEAGGKVSDKQDIVDRLHNILLHEKDGLALTWLATCAANEIERLRLEMSIPRDQYAMTWKNLLDRIYGLDIVEWIRAYANAYSPSDYSSPIAREVVVRSDKRWLAAADEIERLRAELRSYTGDGHNTKGEPCTPNTPS